MQFISITEYFYKLYSAILLITLPPITSFIALYLQPVELQKDIEKEPKAFLLFSTAVLFLWAAMLIFFNKKIKSLRIRQGLRQKLEKYFGLTIVRYLTFCLTGMVLASGFYVLRNDFFTYFFVVQLLLAAMLWPMPSKVSRDLKLKGDEREMVYYKKDVL